MREILYIQAGPFANHVGTHFWNTQETYLSDNAEYFSSEVSWHESVEKGTPMLNPRVLVFDYKRNFGSIWTDAVLDASLGQEEEEESSNLWAGNVVQVHQPAPRRSRYQTSLAQAMSSSQLNTKIPESPIQDDDVRSWADFNRVYYSREPRSLHPVYPDRLDIDGGGGGGTVRDWGFGGDVFKSYDEEIGLMEGPVRLFMEGCDAPQGIQMINDTEEFGSFTVAMAEAIKDEYAKLDLLDFCVRSSVDPHFALRGNNTAEAASVVNDAFFLWKMSELATVCVPLAHPARWEGGLGWCGGVPFKRSALHTSAVVSAHIESSTIDLRMKDGRTSISDYRYLIDNAGGGAGAGPFVQLMGRFPFPSSSSEAFEDGMSAFDYSTGQMGSADEIPGERRDVTRGFEAEVVKRYEDWVRSRAGGDGLGKVTHAPAYPIPSSFPWPASEGQARPQTVPVLTSLGRTPARERGGGIAGLLDEYAKFVRGFVRSGGFRQGLSDLPAEYERDGLGELGEGLVQMMERYGDGLKEE